MSKLCVHWATDLTPLLASMCRLHRVCHLTCTMMHLKNDLIPWAFRITCKSVTLYILNIQTLGLYCTFCSYQVEEAVWHTGQKSGLSSLTNLYFVPRLYFLVAVHPWENYPLFSEPQFCHLLKKAHHCNHLMRSLWGQNNMQKVLGPLVGICFLFVLLLLDYNFWAGPVPFVCPNP